MTGLEQRELGISHYLSPRRVGQKTGRIDQMLSRGSGWESVVANRVERESYGRFTLPMRGNH